MADRPVFLTKEDLVNMRTRVSYPIIHWPYRQLALMGETQAIYFDNDKELEYIVNSLHRNLIIAAKHNMKATPDNHEGFTIVWNKKPLYLLFHDFTLLVGLQGTINCYSY